MKIQHVLLATATALLLGACSPDTPTTVGPCDEFEAGRQCFLDGGSRGVECPTLTVQKALLELCEATK